MRPQFSFIADSDKEEITSGTATWTCAGFSFTHKYAHEFPSFIAAIELNRFIQASFDAGRNHGISEVRAEIDKALDDL